MKFVENSLKDMCVYNKRILLISALIPPELLEHQGGG